MQGGILKVKFGRSNSTHTYSGRLISAAAGSAAIIEQISVIARTPLQRRRDVIPP